MFAILICTIIGLALLTAVAVITAVRISKRIDRITSSKAREVVLQDYEVFSKN